MFMMCAKEHALQRLCCTLCTCCRAHQVHVLMQGKLQSSVGQMATAEVSKGADPVTMLVSTRAKGVGWECLLLVILMLTQLNILVC